MWGTIRSSAKVPVSTLPCPLNNATLRERHDGQNRRSTSAAQECSCSALHARCSEQAFHTRLFSPAGAAFFANSKLLLARTWCSAGSQLNFGSLALGGQGRVRRGNLMCLARPVCLDSCFQSVFEGLKAESKHSALVFRAFGPGGRPRPSGDVSCRFGVPCRRRRA